jgi:hypothetical protein
MRTRAALDVIDAVTGAVVNPHFADAFADRPDVAWIAEGEAPNSGGDFRSGLRVTQGSKPRGEGYRLPNFDHGIIVAYRLH